MGVTYPKIIELLKEEFEVKKTSKYSFCKKTGINPTSVERYLCGISEPNQVSLQKISDYFKLPVWELMGGEPTEKELFFNLLSATENVFIQLLKEGLTDSVDFNKSLLTLAEEIIADKNKFNVIDEKFIETANTAQKFIDKYHGAVIKEMKSGREAAQKPGIASKIRPS